MYRSRDTLDSFVEGLNLAFVSTCLYVSCALLPPEVLEISCSLFYLSPQIFPFIFVTRSWSAEEVIMCLVPLGYDMEYFIIIFIKTDLMTLLSVKKDIYADRVSFSEKAAHSLVISGESTSVPEYSSPSPAETAHFHTEISH